jgi:YD repeat-containing protein
MKTVNLLDGLEWRDSEESGHAQALHYDEHGRALRWTLRPGQAVQEFTTQQTPIYLIVLQGQGMFAGVDGQEELRGPNSLVIFDQGEKHSARALDEDLVFVAILHEGGR